MIDEDYKAKLRTILGFAPGDQVRVKGDSNKESCVIENIFVAPDGVWYGLKMGCTKLHLQAEHLVAA